MSNTMFMWAGSKQRMLKAYEGKLVPNVELKRIVDMFAGGLTCSLYFAEKFNAKLIINDANKEIISMYRHIAYNENELMNEWKKIVEDYLPLSKDERKSFYYSLRDEYTQKFGIEDSIKLSATLLFMLQTNFNGFWMAYKKFDYKYSTPVGLCVQKQSFFNSKEKKIKYCANILRKATILNYDFRDIPLEEGDFIYADPPYRESFLKYQGFIEEDQIALCKLLESHKGFWAYSNSNLEDDFYKTHMPSGVIHDFPVTYTAGRGTTVKAKEVLITNFRS